jgi:hypothetical protein
MSDYGKMSFADVARDLEQWEEHGKRLNKIAAEIKERIGDAPIYITESGEFHVHPDLIEEINKPQNKGLPEYLQYLQRMSIAEKRS